MTPGVWSKFGNIPSAIANVTNPAMASNTTNAIIFQIRGRSAWVFPNGKADRVGFTQAAPATTISAISHIGKQITAKKPAK